jgi:hypothetical protein
MTASATEAVYMRVLEGDRTLGTRPLVLSHAPDTGIRPAGETTALGVSPVSRTDCGWLV